MKRTFSPSALSMFMDCERSYELRYIDKHAGTQDSTEAQNVGKAVHYALEQAARARIAGTISRSFPATGEELNKHLNGIPAYRDLGVRVISRAKLVLMDLPPERMLYVQGAELAFDLKFSDIKIAIKGIIDRVDEFPSGLVRVTDYKTGFPMAGIDPDHSPQTLLYGLAADIMFPYADRLEVRYYYLGMQKKHDVHITRGKLEEAVALLVESHEDLSFLEEQGDTFPARLSARCAGCRYRIACEAYKAEIAERRPESEIGYKGGVVVELVDEYARINGRLAILEGRKKEIAEILKPLFTSSSPIIETSTGCKAKLVSRQVREFRDPREAVELTVKLTGMTHEQVAGEILSASRAKADKLLAHLEDSDRKRASEVLDDATIMSANTFIEVRRGKVK